MSFPSPYLNRVRPFRVPGAGETLCYTGVMPSPGAVKSYVEGGYYHVFNRGNNKQRVFLDNPDYEVFLSFFWELVEDPYPGQVGLSQDITPLTYCLMPSHFHFQLKQVSANGITNLMKRLMIKYVRYFNQRHGRVGRLFQSAFKAKHITDERYLLHLSRYIHLNPSEVWDGRLEDYPFSSYGRYLGKGERGDSLLDTEEILSFFESAQKLSLRDQTSYQSFVEDYQDDDPNNIPEYSLEYFDIQVK